MAAPGRMIFLNGASSSGKSTIARELQRILSDPYLHVGLDAFFDMVPPRFAVGPDPWTITDTLATMISGFHRAVAGLVSAGNNVIVDHVLQQRAWLQECAALYASFGAVFVGVRCPLAELERREAARSDRSRGMARFQYERVHAHRLYDLEVDTVAQTPEQCAKAINAYLRDGSRPTAFERLAG